MPACPGAWDAWRHQPAPSAPGRAGGEVRPRPSGRRRPARLGRAGPGLAARNPRTAGRGRARPPWGPRGWRPGLVGTSRPGAGRALGPGSYQGSWLLAWGPRTALVTPLPMP